MKSNALVLNSGGPDCLVAAGILREDGYKVSFLHFYYGQKADKQEYIAHELIATHFLAPRFRIAINGIYTAMLVGKEGPGILEGQDNPSNVHEAWVPCRNLIMLSIATGFAEAHGFSHLAIGNIVEGAYPDNTVGFQMAFDRVLQHATSEGVHVRCVAPVNLMTKAEVIRRGQELGLPLSATWSCYEGGPVQCGKCGSCIKRRAAFKAAGVEDLTVYYGA